MKKKTRSSPVGLEHDMFSMIQSHDFISVNEQPQPQHGNGMVLDILLYLYCVI